MRSIVYTHFTLFRVLSAASIVRLYFNLWMCWRLSRIFINKYKSEKQKRLIIRNWNVAPHLKLIGFGEYQHLKLLAISDGATTMTLFSSPSLMHQIISNNHMLVGANTHMQIYIVRWLKDWPGFEIHIKSIFRMEFTPITQFRNRLVILHQHCFCKTIVFENKPIVMIHFAIDSNH